MTTHPIALTYGNTLDRQFPLVMVVGREGNNVGTVENFLGDYNWIDSPRSGFWNATYTYFARICGLGTATDSKRLVTSVAFFFGTNLWKIATQVSTDAETDLRNIFNTFIRQTA